MNTNARCDALCEGDDESGARGDGGGDLSREPKFEGRILLQNKAEMFGSTLSNFFDLLHVIDIIIIIIIVIIIIILVFVVHQIHLEMFIQDGNDVFNDDRGVKTEVLDQSRNGDAHQLGEVHVNVAESGEEMRIGALLMLLDDDGASR